MKMGKDGKEEMHYTKRKKKGRICNSDLHAKAKSFMCVQMETRASTTEG